MKQYHLIKISFLALILLLSGQNALAQQNRLEGLRMWQAPDQTRLVFDVQKPVDHKIFTLDRPDRVVIDLSSIELAADIAKQDIAKTNLKRIRSAQRENGQLRIVLDMKEKVTTKSYLLAPNAQYGHRLVVELSPKDAAQKTKTYQSVNQGKRDIIIAIDAGHGGEDPGAVGPNKVYEKDVALAISKELKKLIDQEKGLKAFLIRDGDYFIPLRKRVKKAREMKADLMISIHADSFSDRSAKGASIYTLSPSGASSEQARRLAEKENNSDLIGGVSLDDKDDLLASVLLDLSQTATIEASTDIASRVLSRLKRVAKIHKRQVGQASFMVLKSPDVPSILIETAFISNPSEERKLKSRSHQQKLAKEIVNGVRSFFASNPPPGTLLAASQKHIISRGETLSGIAKQYQVSMSQIKAANNLNTNRLLVGKVLTIPNI